MAVSLDLVLSGVWKCNSAMRRKSRPSVWPRVFITLSADMDTRGTAAQNGLAPVLAPPSLLPLLMPREVQRGGVAAKEFRTARYTY